MVRQILLRLRGLFLAPIICATSGCVDKQVKDALSRSESYLVSESEELRELINKGAVQRISWRDARTRLLSQNIAILRSAERVESLRKKKREQWKTWLPAVTFFASIDKGLNELGDLSLSDLDVSAIAPLRIPNPVSERAEAFELALRLRQAELSHDVTVRQQIISLYRVFLRAERLKEPPTIPVAEGLKDRLQALKLRDAKQRELENIQSFLSSVLNEPGLKAIPIPSSAPNLNYSKRIRKLQPGKNYGKTAILLSALQIESAILQAKGMRFQRLPGFSFSASAPPLYDSRRQNSFSVTEFEDFALFGSASKSYDFTGRDLEAIETAEENVTLVRQQARLELDRDIRSWNRLKSSYYDLQDQQRALNSRLAAIKKGRNTDVGAISKLAMIRKSLSMIADIELQIKNLELQIWLWDDERWER